LCGGHCPFHLAGAGQQHFAADSAGGRIEDILFAVLSERITLAIDPMGNDGGMRGGMWC
jgi:hypothetical protein